MEDKHHEDIRQVIGSYFNDINHTGHASGYIATFNTMMADTGYDLVKAFIDLEDIKPSFTMLGTGTPNKLPTKGYPNTSVKTPDGKQERAFEPDGKAQKDTDYGHPEHHPQLPSPHNHDWEWENGVPKRGPAYASVNWGDTILGVGIITSTAVCIIWVIGNDFTGVGGLDDATLPALVGAFSKGVVLVSGG